MKTLILTDRQYELFCVLQETAGDYDSVQDALCEKAAQLLGHEPKDDMSPEEEEERIEAEIELQNDMWEALVPVSAEKPMALLHHESWEHAVLYRDEEAAMAAFHEGTKPDREEYEQNCGEKLSDEEWWELANEDGMRWTIQTVVAPE